MPHGEWSHHWEISYKQQLDVVDDAMLVPEENATAFSVINVNTIVLKYESNFQLRPQLHFSFSPLTGDIKSGLTMRCVHNEYDIREYDTSHREFDVLAGHAQSLTTHSRRSA